MPLSDYDLRAQCQGQHHPAPPCVLLIINPRHCGPHSGGILQHRALWGPPLQCGSSLPCFAHAKQYPNPPGRRETP